MARWFWWCVALYAATHAVCGAGDVKVTEKVRDIAPRIAVPPVPILPPPLSCVSPWATEARAENRALVPGGQLGAALVQDLLVCELPVTTPWTEGMHVVRTKDGQKRVYALLGAVVVPEQAKIGPEQSRIAGAVETLPQDAQPADQAHDTLLSFAEWKEIQLQNERQRSKSKQRDKARDRSTRSDAVPVSASTAATTITASATASTTMPQKKEPSAQPSAPFAPSVAHAVEEVQAQLAEAPPAAPVLAEENTSETLAKLKHRWNYASLDCAAVVHQANPSAKFASTILSEKKDRYMLSPCGPDQFVIVELCQHIRIDTIVLANLEFFSSIFKIFSVRASTSLHAPDAEWRSLGLFRARNVRGPQVFTLDKVSPSYYRYLRIDFLEHYGSEYYCPVSLLRVYGRNEREDADDEDADEQADEEEVDVESELHVLPQQPSGMDIAFVRGRMLVCPPGISTVWPCECAWEGALDVAPVRTPPTSTDSVPPPKPTKTPVKGEKTLLHSASLTPLANTTLSDIQTQAANRTSTTIPASPRVTTKSAEPKAQEKGGGESIYRTITKRLSALEANTSLSMEYLQLSSQVLRDKLTLLEQSQESRVAQLLTLLNESNYRQLETFQKEQRASLHHTHLNYEMHQQRADFERRALMTRIQQLSDALQYERRWGFAQLLLLLTTLLIFAFTRTSALSTASGHRARADWAPPRFAAHPSSPVHATSPFEDDVPTVETEHIQTAARNDARSMPLSRDLTNIHRPIPLRTRRASAFTTPSPARAKRMYRTRPRIAPQTMPRLAAPAPTPQFLAPDTHPAHSRSSSFAASSEWSEGGDYEL